MILTPASIATPGSSAKTRDLWAQTLSGKVQPYGPNLA